MQQERVENLKRAEQDRVSRSVLGGSSSPPKDSLGTDSSASRRKRVNSETIAMTEGNDLLGRDCHKPRSKNNTTSVTGTQFKYTF